MQPLAPHISCICTPAELETAKAEGYKEMYMITSKGIFKHHVLRGNGRFVQVQVDTIPGYIEATITPSMNFLPAGKISYEIYDQVLAFFKKVMEVKNSEVEAMIHILYNAELGYHLGVPPQTISKASVSYDWNYVPEGTSIVVDIHSHNTMGAFFSGTDDRDDLNNISYSGVFGKLKDRNPETVWRFNYMKQKFQVKLEDLFQVQNAPDVAIPAEWLEKVTVQLPYQGNVGRRGAMVNGRWDMNAIPPTPGVQWAANGSRQSPNPNYYSGGDITDGSGTFFGFDYDEYDAAFSNYNKAQASPGVVLDSTGKPVNGNRWGYDPKAPSVGIPPTPQVSGGRFIPPVSSSIIIEDGDAIVADFYAKNKGVLKDIREGNEGYYEALAVTHGVGVADAWKTINDEMIHLIGEDEISTELITEMFNLQDENTQVELVTKLFEQLSPREKEKIQTHGF